MKNSGIYKITNTINGHFYVGSAADIEKRWNKHSSLLRIGKHHSQYLQHAWNKYGDSCFDFSVLEICDEDNLIVREQFYIDKLCPKYNMCPTAGSRLGIEFSNEHRRKISIALSGITRSSETRQKISNSKKGKPSGRKGKTLNDIWKKKLSDAHKGISLSESHRESLSLALKGRPSPMKGKTHSDESRKKMSESMKESRRRRKELNNS